MLLLALEGDSDMCTFTTTTIAVAIVERAITIWEAIQKRSHAPIYKTYTKNEAKGLRATTLLSQNSKSDT